MTRAHDRKRIPNWALGLLFVVLVIVGSILAFTKQLPWGDAYEVKAVFATAQNVRVDSPVRIAGVEVGKVTGVEHLSPETDPEVFAAAGDSAGEALGGGTETPAAAIVTMEINESGQPIKSDATFHLRPRLFLEGNLFVDLHPGSPSAAEVEDGHEFPPDQTAVSVQLDQILTTLQSDVREQLQIALEEFGAALVDHGGAEGFQELYRTSPGAYKYTSQVNEAFLGTQTHDLSSLIRNLDRVVAALGRNEEQLKGLITNFRIFSGSFAAQDEALAEAIAELPGVLDAAEPAFASLNRAFPPLRAFAREALPGTRTAPETLDAAIPFIHQVRELVAKDELRGLVADLRPTVPRLTTLAEESVPFLDETRALSSCFNEVVIPWGYDTVDPPSNYPHQPTGRVFEETGYGLAGITGETRSGDANGFTTRVQAGGGTNTVVAPPAPGVPQQNQAFGLTAFPLEGATPSFHPIEDSEKTKFKPKVPCERQEPPDLGSTLGTPPEQMPTEPGLPPVLEEFQERYLETVEDFGEAGQLADDGETRAAREQESDTLTEYRELLEEYEKTVNEELGG